ncbi:MAG: type II toxin-antitoxin system VapC family toxin [Methylorubrum extorquens]|uniref:Twitching motility protein PilT n=2 Tax=Methylorubrum extorquens TaxID=408 RepID=A0A1S1NX37_METEX|nr:MULTISPECIES: type II toxin-antitoxin system VapC family toxin [Methylobacteriaceae]KQO94207.1 twitching motility protein PilT [Methylobacterium sp. Leaf92]KQQ15082.1 twitching motility protein PilT [Methylobacterium sp. Leaf121]ARO53072.1 twitching motility protein PilT [Methylorubrum zatmanii]KQQ17706.1 twitching motility protein PilT [Methylobacterium sp. Leaf122]OHV15258.1 twitching motility protein PilT [Methylorubrum extorquens]
MRLLLDTHLLIWVAEGSARLPASVRTSIEDPDLTPVFSIASLWEIAIKRSLGRPDFRIDSRILYRGLIENGYEELPVLGKHAVAVEGLPLIHKDPFDRLLVAQATVEGITLLTSDALVARYPGPIRRV